MPNGDSPERNIDYGRRFLLAANDRDTTALESFVHEETRWYVAGRNPASGEHLGITGLLNVWRLLAWKLNGVNFPPTGAVDFIVESVDASDGSFCIAGITFSDLGAGLPSNLVTMWATFGGDFIRGCQIQWSDPYAVDDFYNALWA